MSCGVGRRRGSDPALLWLWGRLVAAAPIRPLAWEPPYAAGAAQEIATTTTTTATTTKRQKTKKKNVKKKKTKKKNKLVSGVPLVVQWLRNPTRNHEVASLILGLAQWVNDPALP